MSPALPVRYDMTWRRGNALALIVLCAIFATALGGRALDRPRPVSEGHDTDPARLAAARQRVDPNTATSASLRRLPTIGPVKAGAIVDYRRTHGPIFTTVEDLQRVVGIGPGTVRRIAPYMTIPARK